jgi:predicted dehydrogenase
MSEKNNSIRIGVVGAARRGKSFAGALRGLGYTVAAVCDVNTDVLAECRRQMEAEAAFDDYQQMLDVGRLDAVLIATPMQLHAPQAIAALQRGIHVLSEVTAATSLEQCRQLVAATRQSKAVYMMAENYIYVRHIQFIAGLVKAGLFGELFYAEGEYLHELKELFEETPWRRTWQGGLRGVTYPTHSVGPILAWMDDDRIRQISCADSGSHYKDPRGQPYAGDTAVFLGRTVKGRLIKIRVDLVSDRPHSMNTHQLQGTDGCFESSRGGPGDRHKIWLRGVSRNRDHWLDMETLMEQQSFQQYLPDLWRNPPEALARAGHGGGDYYVLDLFARVVRGQIANPLDIHRALDLTLPGLISQEAVTSDQWLEVPDSRQWT